MMEARLQRIPAAPRELARYEGVAPPEQLDRARELAGGLAGARVLHLSAVPAEPADASASLAPLLRDLGLEADRAVLYGDRAFQALALAAGDALRGGRWEPAGDELTAFLEACEGAAVAFDLRAYDVIVVQGVGAAALIEGRRSGDAAWLWRSGVDASRATPAVATWLAGRLRDYARLSFALPEFVLAGAGAERTSFAPGAFDPLGPRQAVPAPGELGALLRPFGADLSRPLVCQVGMLDSWSDPPAVIEAWRGARESVPGLQLAIAGRVDPTDPEAPGILEEIRAFAGPERDLIVLTDRLGAGDRVLGAAAWVARCAVHATLSDGFDPEVAASLWRGTPVIAEGRGAAAQIGHGTNGFVVASARERAERVAELAGDPGRSAALGRAGRQRAAQRFGIVRAIGDELEMIGAVLGGGPTARRHRQGATL